MPVPDLPGPPDGNGTEAGRTACHTYVHWVGNMIHSLIHDAEYGRLFDERLRAAAQLAWIDLISDDAFVAVHRGLDEASDDALRSHGLYGNQLRFKWAVVSHWLARWRGGDGLLRQFIKVVDDLLDSILSVAGAGGAIKEIKEFLGASTTE